MVKAANGNSDNSNPYFLAWSIATQTTELDPEKWYKIVGYVLPEGYPIQSNSNWGGVYEVSSGTRIANVNNYRWSEDRASNSAHARFFTYYSQGQQNTFTNYFYLPEVRVTSVSYSPVVPTISITHSSAPEGAPLSFTLILSEPTTVTTKVYYTVNHPGGSGSASANDYTSASSTLVVFPQGAASAAISVNTTEDSIYEGNEAVRLNLSSPVRAVIAESSERAYILNDDPAPPGVPGVMSVPSLVSPPNNYAISWGASNGSVARYEVEQHTNASFTAQVLSWTTTNLSITSTASTEGIFYFRVRACNASGCSGYRNGSNSLRILRPPAAPTGMAMQLVSYCTWRPTWNAVLNAASYKVTDTNNTIRTTAYNYASIPWSSTCPPPQGVTPNSNKPKWVRACNDAGCSADASF